MTKRRFTEEQIAFASAWKTGHAYQCLNVSSKVVHVLTRLNQTYLHNKTEQISIDSALTVEHILPQRWIDHWPLPDGAQGLTLAELANATTEDVRATATRRRNLACQTWGNLTILTQPLNSAVSNSSWEKKKPAMMQASLLPINQRLGEATVWDEDAIEIRGVQLFERVCKVWPGPSVS